MSEKSYPIERYLILTKQLRCKHANKPLEPNCYVR